jgi:hypothetical protein
MQCLPLVCAERGTCLRCLAPPVVTRAAAWAQPPSISRPRSKLAIVMISSQLGLKWTLSFLPRVMQCKSPLTTSVHMHLHQTFKHARARAPYTSSRSRSFLLRATSTCCRPLRAGAVLFGRVPKISLESGCPQVLLQRNEGRTHFHRRAHR